MLKKTFDLRHLLTENAHTQSMARMIAVANRQGPTKKDKEGKQDMKKTVHSKTMEDSHG